MTDFVVVRLPTANVATPFLLWSLQNQDLLLLISPLYSVWLFFVWLQCCVGSIIAYPWNSIHHCNSVYLASIVALFCHRFCTLYSIVLLWFSPQSCWHTLHCSGVKDNLCIPASLSLEHIGTAVLICPQPIVGLFAFGRNTTPMIALHRFPIPWIF